MARSSGTIVTVDSIASMTMTTALTPLSYVKFSLCRTDLTHTASSSQRLAIWSQTVKRVTMR
jgi:hypothetical protein